MGEGSSCALAGRPVSFGPESTVKLSRAKIVIFPVIFAGFVLLLGASCSEESDEPDDSQCEKPMDTICIGGEVYGCHYQGGVSLVRSCSAGLVCQDGECVEDGSGDSVDGGATHDHGNDGATHDHGHDDGGATGPADGSDGPRGPGKDGSDSPDGPGPDGSDGPGGLDDGGGGRDDSASTTPWNGACNSEADMQLLSTENGISDLFMKCGGLCEDAKDYAGCHEKCFGDLLASECAKCLVDFLMCYEDKCHDDRHDRPDSEGSNCENEYCMPPFFKCTGMPPDLMKG